MPKSARWTAFSYDSCLEILQAWIVFADVTAATNALKGMQGFPVYEKPMVRILEAVQLLHIVNDSRY